MQYNSACCTASSSACIELAYFEPAGLADCRILSRDCVPGTKLTDGDGRCFHLICPSLCQLKSRVAWANLPDMCFLFTGVMVFILTCLELWGVHY